MRGLASGDVELPTELAPPFISGDTKEVLFRPCIKNRVGGSIYSSSVSGMDTAGFT